MVGSDGPPVNISYMSGIAVVLVAPDGPVDRLAAAVAALGGRIVARSGWDAMPHSCPVAQVVAVEAAGTDSETLAARLPEIAAWAIDQSAALVVAMDADQIDAVAAVALGGTTALLVDPGIGDCAAALAVAGEHARSPVGVFDIGRESDSKRLERLNAEVARIAETLARLTRAEHDRDAGPPSIVGDRTTPYGAPPGADDPNAADIRRAIRSRRLRDQFFGPALFEDPGWDMLLDLYAAELEQVRVSVSSLCIAAAVAPTTALRWIGRMTDAGLFERQPDPLDRRRAFMALSRRASAAMRGYIAAVKRGELGIA